MKHRNESCLLPASCRLFSLLLLFLCGTLPTWASSPSTSSQKLQYDQRPPFVSHVGGEALQEAMALVKSRHMQAVQEALQAYPTHMQIIALNDKTIAHTPLEDVSLQEYSIVAPGTLPDTFDGQLQRRILVTDNPLLSRDECAQVIAWAEDHFSAQGSWPIQQSGDYDVAGCWIKDVPKVKEWFVQTCRQRLFPLLARAFPDFCEQAEDLCVDKTYLFKYTPDTGGRTGVHTDAGCLSFTIALNSKQEYTGGGTWFEGLKQGKEGVESNVLEMNVGQVAIRPGGVKHAGHPVTSGVRYVIGGFCMNQKKPEPVRMLLTPASSEEAASSQLRALEAAVAINPNFFGSYTLLANEYKRLGNVPKAREVLEYCLEHVHPLAGEAAYSLGMMYLDQGEFEKAKKCLETCLQDDPHDTEAMMALAQLSSLQGDKRGEESYYNLVLSTPGTQARVKASAYCNLGVLYEEQDAEIDYYLKALELRPDTFAARYSLASAYASRNQWEEAVKHFRRALEDSGSNEHTVMTLELLYRSAVSLMLSQPNPPTTQQEAINRIQEIMGADNFSRLAASRS